LVIYRGKTLNQLPGTQNYVKRVIKQWIEEYKIDGFRWDLTKDLHKTVRLQMRVALILTNKKSCIEKSMRIILGAWTPHYIILAFRGTEEQQWANRR
jgi:pullulanase/glycogen debranching enzyme